jgi:hypothetical protein
MRLRFKQNSETGGEMPENYPIDDDKWVTEHVRRYWLFDKRVVVYQPTGVSRPIVDEWFATVMETLQAWPENQTMLAIHDMRAATLTPYVRARSQELTRKNAHVRGHSLIVLPKNLYGEFIRIFINTVITRDQPHIKRVVMTSLDEAIAYMQRVLDEEKSKP